MIARGCNVNLEAAQFNDDIHPTKKKKRTPLIAAAAAGHVDVVTRLLAARADVEQGMYTVCVRARVYIYIPYIKKRAMLIITHVLADNAPTWTKANPTMAVLLFCLLLRKGAEYDFTCVFSLFFFLFWSFPVSFPTPSYLLLYHC